MERQIKLDPMNGKDFREKEKTVAIKCHMDSDIPRFRDGIQPNRKFNRQKIGRTW
jgi:hypothetical protein